MTQLLSFEKVFLQHVSHLVINHWCWPDCAWRRWMPFWGVTGVYFVLASAYQCLWQDAPHPVLLRFGSWKGHWPLLSSSHRWTWTRLVLEAEEEAVIDFSLLSSLISPLTLRRRQSFCAKKWMNKMTAHDIYSQESQHRQMVKSNFISTW